MNFTIDKESLLNKLRIVDKITIQRGIQPVLANILFEAADNNLNLTATDLDLTIKTKTTASVKEEGKITLPAKKISEIISKLPDKPIVFSLNKDNNVVTIKCGSSKFEVIGISAEEFPKIENMDCENNENSIEINSDTFIKSIKYSVYATASTEMKNIINGVFCCINDNSLEMAATDGNRLTCFNNKIVNEKNIEFKKVIPAKTLNEIIRIDSIVKEDKISILAEDGNIIIKTNSWVIKSKLLEGEYPPYKKLIPQNTENKVIINREEFIKAIELVSCMVNEKTNVVKFFFNNGKVILKAQALDNSGESEDIIDCNYNKDELVIAFNYKFVLDFIKTIECKELEIGISGSLSATVFKPVSDEDYICLIMPMQV